MQITLENATPDFSRQVNGIPPIDTQRATTQVQVDDGATTIIGGIFVSREQIVERAHAAAAPRAAARLAVQARYEHGRKPRAADLHHAAHLEGLSIMSKAVWGAALRLCAVIGLGFAAASCGTVARQGTASSFLIIKALEGGVRRRAERVRRHAELRCRHRRRRRRRRSSTTSAARSSHSALKDPGSPDVTGRAVADQLHHPRSLPRAVHPLGRPQRRRRRRAVRVRQRDHRDRDDRRHDRRIHDRAQPGEDGSAP